MREQVYAKKDIEAIAEKIAGELEGCAIVTLTGSLGAGKTTLAGAILKRLGVKEPVTSPTFTYVQLYTTKSGKTVYHFDLYRINSLDDFMQAGFDEYLYQPNSLVFIEWPESILPLITRDACHLTIEYKDAESRLITFVRSEDTEEST